MISIVIPLFNKANTILQTLSTVLNQTFKDFEVIIVDDGSTDNGRDLIKSYISDPRVYVLSQENQGVSAARNKGIIAAKYNYIAFLDGDDEWLPNYLSKMWQAIIQFPDAGMYCCAGYIRNGDKVVSLRIAKKYINKVLEINFFENPHVFLHSSAVIASKNELCKIGGFIIGMQRNEDFALFFSLALTARVVYCGFPLSVYVGGVNGQATNTPINEMLNHVVGRFNYVFDKWTDSGCQNKSFSIFMKYEIRHFMLINLLDNDYKAILFFIENIKPSILIHFRWFERYLYKFRFFKQVAILIIYLTKVRWRARGYPYIGQRINYLK